LLFLGDVWYLAASTWGVAFCLRCIGLDRVSLLELVVAVTLCLGQTSPLSVFFYFPEFFGDRHKLFGNVWVGWVPTGYLCKSPVELPFVLSSFAY
jgi:hypothetical protein